MKKNTLLKNKGMTLLELTVVILVLLSLIGVLFIGATAWKEGSDRSTCILNIRNAQVAVRSWANLNNKTGDGAAGSDTFTAATDIIGAGKFMSSAPVCPGGGDYTWIETYNTAAGTVFVSCSLSATKDHSPTGTTGW